MPDPGDHEANPDGDSLPRRTAIRTAYDLWANESVVKTQKLRSYLTAQSILVAGVGIGLGSSRIWIVLAVVGFLLSVLMVLSIARTDAFQENWREEIEALLAETPEETASHLDLFPEDFDDKPRHKRIQKGYIVVVPVLGAIGWFLLGGLLLVL